MPSSNHRRTLSWPPVIRTIDPNGIEDLLPEIDDDPFSYFLSPSADDFQRDDALAWSAGILEPPSTKKDTKFGTSMGKKWAKFIAKTEPDLHEKFHNSDSDDNDEDYIWPEQNYKIDRMDWSPPHLKPQTLTHSPPLRGRAPHHRPHAQLRPEPPRPIRHRRSWVEPTPEISTVFEETENGSSEDQVVQDPIERVDTPFIPELSLDEDVIVEEKKVEKKVRFKLDS